LGVFFRWVYQKRILEKKQFLFRKGVEIRALEGFLKSGFFENEP
jgi:hypothetical protein